MTRLWPMSVDLITSYIAHLRERGCTPRTLETYEWILSTADKTMPYGLASANRAEIRAWLWRDGLKSATRATYYGALSGFFRHHVETGELDFDPAAGISRPKVAEGYPRVAGDQAVQVMLTQAAQPYRLWATLAAYEGLRCIEIERLRREHVTERTTTVHLGKGNKKRIIPTHPLVWAAVKDLPPGPIADLDAQDISNRFIKACQRLGLNGMSMHRLRGWYATKGYGATKDLRAVQRNMGHARPGTTAGYIDIPYDDQQAVTAGLPVFEPPAADL